MPDIAAEGGCQPLRIAHVIFREIGFGNTFLKADPENTLEALLFISPCEGSG